jgi:hypothetical protein
MATQFSLFRSPPTHVKSGPDGTGGEMGTAMGISDNT